MSESSSSSGGIGLIGALGLLFIGLKLGGVIQWSWWWVLLPFWGGLAIWVVILAIIGIFALLSASSKRSQSRKYSPHAASGNRAGKQEGREK